MSDTSTWESVKENTAPLQRGRNVDVLERAASAGALQPRRDDRARRIEEFEALVHPSESPFFTELQGSDNPLEHWTEYIKFCQENFPSDNHKQFLLMERCTRALVKVPSYANDDRFIAACVRYADKAREPTQVFKYLHQQKVGQRSALFWVAWAFVAERDGDFRFAEQIYQKGMDKEARPMNTLKVRHKQFQRRMSRLWLNSSQQQDQLDDEAEENHQHRGALGGLSRERVRRNDRGRSAPVRQSRLGSRRPLPSSGGATQTSSGTSRLGPGAPNSGNGPFSIFVEKDGENAPANYLDQPIVENARILEKQTERLKENTLEAERWNERGGLPAGGTTSSAGAYLTSRSSQGRSSSRGAPPPFAVFVDKECIVQHEKEELEKQNQASRHRHARDDRTFRDRSEECMAERLTRDPLRYVRDPSKFEADLASERTHSQKESDGTRSTSQNEKAKNRAHGFRKSLLTNPRGVEQCFEEERSNSNWFVIASSATNFNLMHVNKADESSQMDLDQSESCNTSMGNTSHSLGYGSDGGQHVEPSSLDENTKGAVMFKSDPCFEASLNQTAISTASSALNESDAVGVPTKREEETINTKFAMRELSMMFSSPAFGVNDAARSIDGQANGEMLQDVNDVRESSFENVGDDLGQSMLDNSILNSGSENDGPRNPNARANTPGFSESALRGLRSDVDVSCDIFSCHRQRPRLDKCQAYENPPGRSQYIVDPGFQIYEEKAAVTAGSVSFNIYEDAGKELDDCEYVKDASKEATEEIFDEKKPAAGTPFAIYEDSTEENEDGFSSKGIGKGPHTSLKATEERIEKKPAASAPFAIYKDSAKVIEDGPSLASIGRLDRRGPRTSQEATENKVDKKQAAGTPFAIYEDSAEDNEDDSSISGGSDHYAQGDTATFSLLGDISGVDDNAEQPAGSPNQSASTARSEQGDTATLSIFNEVFQSSDCLDDSSSPSRVFRPSKSNQASSIDVEEGGEASDGEKCSASQSRKRKFRLSSPTSQDGSSVSAVQYEHSHEYDCKMALRRLQTASTVASNSRAPLSFLLSAVGQNYHLPHLPVPRQFRSKCLSDDTEVQIGKHGGCIHRELGRGVYGVVVLMEHPQQSESSEIQTIAVKVQSPANCLAFECEILRKVEERLDHAGCESTFPRAFSFISLADGAILSMSAGSETGLNLVDLVNVYKKNLGEHIPEIIALHYVSRLLRHLEHLHWHGKILHCDVKPDNVVMCRLQCGDNIVKDVEFSEVMLVDFGRAVDLEDQAKTIGSGSSARSVLLQGEACKTDMQCVSMRDGKPWSYDVDTFGVLSCAHVMLFGTHISIRKGRSGRWGLGNAIKRYWQKSLWAMIFDTLLNLDEESGAAIGSRARSLRSLRERIEEYTSHESDRLRSCLCRQLKFLPSRREQLNK